MAKIIVVAEQPMERAVIDSICLELKCKEDDLIMVSHDQLTPEFLKEQGIKPSWERAAEQLKQLELGMADFPKVDLNTSIVVESPEQSFYGTRPWKRK